MKIQYITYAGWQNGYFQLLRGIPGELPKRPQSASEILGIINTLDAETTIRRLLIEGNQVFADDKMLNDVLLDKIAHSVPPEALVRIYMVSCCRPKEGFPISSLSC